MAGIKIAPGSGLRLVARHLFLAAALSAGLFVGDVSLGHALRSRSMEARFDHNSTDVHIVHMTQHKEVSTGRKIRKHNFLVVKNLRVLYFPPFSDLSCKVEYFTGSSSSSEYGGGGASRPSDSSTPSPSSTVVDWVFLSSEGEHAKPVILATDGVPTAAAGGRWRAQRRKSWNFVNNADIEDHYLDLDAAEAKDQGMYICQVARVVEKHIRIQHAITRDKC